MDGEAKERLEAKLREIAFVRECAFWDEYPGHPVDDWKYEVANGDTRVGYWDWVESRIAEEFYCNEF